MLAMEKPSAHKQKELGIFKYKKVIKKKKKRGREAKIRLP